MVLTVDLGDRRDVALRLAHQVSRELAQVHALVQAVFGFLGGRGHEVQAVLPGNYLHQELRHRRGRGNAHRALAAGSLHAPPRFRSLRRTLLAGNMGDGNDPWHIAPAGSPVGRISVSRGHRTVYGATGGLSGAQGDLVELTYRGNGRFEVTRNAGTATAIP